MNTESPGGIIGRSNPHTSMEHQFKRREGSLTASPILEANDDLHSQRSVDGVPDAVRVTNYPLISSERHGGQNLLNADLGIFVRTLGSPASTTRSRRPRQLWIGSTSTATTSRRIMRLTSRRFQRGLAGRRSRTRPLRTSSGPIPSSGTRRCSTRCCRDGRSGSPITSGR